MTQNNMFASWPTFNLSMWLAQYSGKQAGFYPGLRKLRLQAEREWQRRNEAGETWLDTAGVIPQYPANPANTKFWLQAKREAV